jgi:hypothetical protein
MAADLDPAPARDAASSGRVDGALVIDLAHQRPAPTAPAASPARAALASAIASVTSASAALERAQQPVSRLTGLIAEHDSLTRKLADLRAVEEERLTAWLIAGSVGPRPVPAQEIVELDRELQTGAPDVAAARKALESLQPDVARAADSVRSASLHRDQAAFAAALQVCHEYITDRYEPALVVLSIAIGRRSTRVGNTVCAERVGARKLSLASWAAPRP